jgi:hypothetical protein
MSTSLFTRSHATAIGAALALAACAGGCGGSGHHATPSARIDQAFLARANGVCAAALARVQANGPFPYPNFDPLHPSAAMVPRVVAFFRPLVPIDRAVPGQLRALGEPASGRQQWDRLRDLVTRDETNAVHQVAVGEAGDVKGFVATRGA